MCSFFSARVTARGIFWAEDWSHKTVGERLGIVENFVDVEYDAERGLEVHEPFRLPVWFVHADVAARCKDVHDRLLPVHAEFQPRLAALKAEFRSRRAALDAEIDSRWAELVEKYNSWRAALVAEFQPRWAAVEGYVPPRAEAENV